VVQVKLAVVAVTLIEGGGEITGPGPVTRISVVNVKLLEVVEAPVEFAETTS
jgi:hypothetical protein